MLGPLPTGSSFIAARVSKVYGTPAAPTARQTSGSLWYSKAWNRALIGYTHKDYLGAPLPFSSDTGVRRTSRGPLYVTPVNYTMRSTVSIFDTIDMQGTLSGVHDVTALISTVSNLFGTLDGDATVVTPPNLYGVANATFLLLDAVSLMGNTINLLGDATNIGNLADASAAISATVTNMQGEYNTFNLAADSTAYLFTYNLTTGPLRSAAALAW